MKKLIVIIIIVLLTITSLFLLGYSTNISSKYSVLLNKQIVWNIIGIFFLFIILIIKKQYIFKYSKIIYVLNLILLIIPLLFSDSVNGIKAWINVGFFSFQPSEFMKISLSLILANYLSKSKQKDIIKIIYSFIITIIPSILVFLEPDTGSIIIYFVIFFIILFINNINIKYFIIILFISLTFIGLFIYFYKVNINLIISLFGTNIFYRIDRLINFANKSNMQLNNALISIGSSNYFGHGINNNILYFPEAPTDFIFSLIISILGYIYGIFIVIIIALLDIVLIKVIKKEKSNKMRLLLTGLFGSFVYQQIQNILMNLGLLPIIGITLPFLSYGGSSLFVYYVFIGLCFKSMIKNNYL